MAACFRQNMGMLNIRVFAGGPLANPARPERLAVLTSGTDVDNEMRCAAAVRAALGNAYGTPAQTALRFVLGNHDLSTRVIGIGDLRNLDEAFAAVEEGPLPPEAVEQARAAVGDGFPSVSRVRALRSGGDCIIVHAL